MLPLLVNEPERCLCRVKVEAVSLTRKGRREKEKTVTVSEKRKTNYMFMDTCSMLDKRALYYSNLSTMTYGGKTQETTIIIYNSIYLIQMTDAFFFNLFDYINLP